MISGRMMRVLALAVAGLLVGVGVASADGMLADFPTEDLGFVLMAGTFGAACLLSQRAAWAALPARADLPPDTPPDDRWGLRLPLLIALAAAGFISAEEALAAAQTGAVPTATAAIFDLLPAGQALAARITWATMTEVYREDPLVAALVAAGLPPLRRWMGCFG
jgi:hypothetical protein